MKEDHASKDKLDAMAQYLQAREGESYDEFVAKQEAAEAAKKLQMDEEAWQHAALQDMKERNRIGKIKNRQKND